MVIGSDNLAPNVIGNDDEQLAGGLEPKKTCKVLIEAAADALISPTVNKTRQNNYSLSTMTSREQAIAKVKGKSSESMLFRRVLTLESTAQLQERDTTLRESWVKAMEARLVQEELGKCQKQEGVNHYENCKWLADKYLAMLKENRVRLHPHDTPKNN